MVLDILTIAVLIALTVLTGVVVVILGMLPGRIAKRRNHPQAEAINVASWLGIITLGLLWPFALIWAYIRPLEPSALANSELTSLGSRVEALEEQVRRIGQNRGTP
jgi:CBS domain containing-hemolysin-like protein